jgi:hypothetical protein
MRQRRPHCPHAAHGPPMLGTMLLGWRIHLSVELLRLL